MISASIVLVVAALAWLVVGVLRGGSPYYYQSMAASGLAAAVLIVGLRHRRSQPGATDRAGRHAERSVGLGRRRSAAPVADPVPAVQGTGILAEAALPDEPDQQFLPLAVLDQLGGLQGEVAVIDGRPRYHRSDCLHLLGRQTEWLPVSEAVQLRFTPCADCAPATLLLRVETDPR